MGLVGFEVLILVIVFDVPASEGFVGFVVVFHVIGAEALVGVADFHVVIGDEQVALVALRTRGGKFSHASFSGRLVSLLGKGDVWCRSPEQQNADQAKKESRLGEIPSVRAVI